MLRAPCSLLSRSLLFALTPLLLALLLLAPSSLLPATVLPKATYAYSWTKVNSTLDNIVPFYWLRLSDLSDPNSAVIKAKAATDSMPEGHRVLFSWDLHREMSYHPSDALKDSLGKIVGYTDKENRFIPYHGIWWDHGVEVIQRRFDDFFRRYSAIGGRVDVVVLDFEEGFSNWHLENKAKREYGGATEAYFLAIQNDPRFSSVSQELGFSDLRTVLHWYSNENYLKWNALMSDRVAAYINKAVYEPIKKYFPNVKMTNYGNYYHSMSYPVPDRNGHPTYKYGNGNHVGTHQSRSLYGWLGNVRNLRLDGTNKYDATSFNAFRHDVNKIRAMKLSSNVPIYAWVSNKEFGESLLNSSDLYQELIFHIGLTGVEGFLFWNPTETSTPATSKSNELLSDCLKQMDQLVGFDDRKTLVDRLVGWGDHYVLTGMRANNRSVWRFTPKLEGKETIENILVNVFPATFRVGSTTVTVPNGKVLIPDNRLSQQGYWIVEATESREQGAGSSEPEIER